MALDMFSFMMGASAAAKGSTDEGIIIQAFSSQLVNGHVVPVLTAEEVTKAYNAIVAGRHCTITDAPGTGHFTVLQGDLIGGEPCISFLYYSVMILYYYIEDNEIVTTFTDIDLSGVIAPEYIEGYSYNQGVLVMHDGGLYQANQAITPEPWTEAHWTRTTINAILQTLINSAE